MFCVTLTHKLRPGVLLLALPRGVRNPPALRRRKRGSYSPRSIRLRRWAFSCWQPSTNGRGEGGAPPPGIRLMDSVYHFASRLPAIGPCRKVEEIVVEFLADRERAGVSGHNSRNIRCRLGRVSDTFRSCPIVSLTLDLISTYLVVCSI